MCTSFGEEYTVARTYCVWTSCGSDLLCPELLWLGPTVSGPPVARTSCGLDLQESQPQEGRGRHCHRRSERSHSHRRSEGAKMMEAAGSQEVHRVQRRSARRPDVSGSHSRSILDPIRSSWFFTLSTLGRLSIGTRFYPGGFTHPHSGLNKSHTCKCRKFKENIQ